MNDMIGKLTKYIQYFGIAVVIIFAIGATAYYFYSKKKRKISHKYEDIDYSNLVRNNSKDYIKVDDIKDDVVITDNYTRFIGVISCNGFDFYSAHATEQGATVQNYLSFINTINEPITYRQYCKSADVEETFDNYKEAYKNVCDKLLESLTQMEKIAYSYEHSSIENEKALYAQKLSLLDKEISALEFRKFHLEDQMRYIEQYSGNRITPLLSETYVFDWSSSRLEYSEQLSDDELFEKAKRELMAIANSKIHALAACGVKAKRCSTEELIDMYRRHSQPISSERYKKREIRNCKFSDDIVTTDDIERIYSYVKNVLQEENSSLLDNTFSDENITSLIASAIDNASETNEPNEPDEIMSF